MVLNSVGVIYIINLWLVGGAQVANKLMGVHALQGPCPESTPQLFLH